MNNEFKSYNIMWDEYLESIGWVSQQGRVKVKIYTLHLNEALLDQIIYALMVRMRELHGRPDLDYQLVTHTQAALEMAQDAKERKR